MSSITIPDEVSRITSTLENGGSQAYLVGGCTRDLILGRKPKDWDITTDADPEKIEKLFPHTFYTNTYGTVTVVNDDAKDETLKNIEITPFRKEGVYSDKRHPDGVVFTKSLEEDLSRRDFTINAIAYSVSKGQFIDPYKGQDDIKDKVIRTVGDPVERFSEDALRMMRAIRLAAELGFTLNTDTMKALKETAQLLNEIAMERVRDEFSKIIMTEKPMPAIEVARETGIINYILPELLEGVGIQQNQAHSYEVWEHNLRSLQHAANRGWSFHVKLSALLHDIGKPRARLWEEKKKDWTFHGHDVIGAKMTKNILERLKFSRETTDVVTKLVRYHLFFSDTEKITLSAVRRVIRKVGPENIWELMKLRSCDRIGTGRPKETPYRLRKYESMIEEALRDPISVSMLALGGSDIMRFTGTEPGPKIGYILHALLEDVLDDPKRNTEEYLGSRAKELAALSEDELKKLGQRGKERKGELEEAEIQEIRKRHWVQ